MPVAAGMYYVVHEGGNPEKPPIVLIHGEGASQQIWPVELRHLSGFRVYAPDLPGHGKSRGAGQHSIYTYASCLMDFISDLGLSQAVFVGHSMGSAIALAAALEHRSHVIGLGLIGGGAALEFPTDLLEYSARQNTLPIAVERLAQRSFGPQTPATLVDTTVQQLLETRRGVLSGDLKACSTFDIRSQLNRIRVPLILFCGSEDRLTPPAYAHMLATSIPATRLRLYYGAGHILMLEHPEALAEDLVEFLADLPSQVGRG